MSWTVLGVARMLYTARTHDIASKSGAGRWIIDELPEYRALVEHAVAIREAAHTTPDGRDTARETAEFTAAVADLIEDACRSQPA